MDKVKIGEFIKSCDFSIDKRGHEVIANYELDKYYYGDKKVSPSIKYHKDSPYSVASEKTFRFDFKDVKIILFSDGSKEYEFV